MIAKSATRLATSNPPPTPVLDAIVQITLRPKSPITALQSCQPIVRAATVRKAGVLLLSTMISFIHLLGLTSASKTTVQLVT
jgi:hypothetical protein